MKNSSKFLVKNDYNSKNKNEKNLKFDFSYDSADSGSFMYIWLILKKKVWCMCVYPCMQNWRDSSGMPLILTLLSKCISARHGWKLNMQDQSDDSSSFCQNHLALDREFRYGMSLSSMY